MEDGLLSRYIHLFLLRARDSHRRIVVDKGRCHLVDRFKVNHRKDSLDCLVLPLQARHQLAILKMGDTLTRQVVVLACVALVVALLHRIELLVLGALQLICCESVSTHFLQLVQQVIVGFRLLALFGDRDSQERIALLDDLAISTSGSREGCLRIHRQVGKTRVHHIAYQFAHQIYHIGLSGTLQYFG